MSVERHDIQEENTGAYVLGALTGFEERAFERHLDECPVCSDEVARLRTAVEALPRSVLPVSAPASLKTSLMKVVEAEARDAAGRPRGLTVLRERLAAAGNALAGLRPRTALVVATCLLGVGVLTGYAATSMIGDGGDPRSLAAKVDKQRNPGANGSLTVSSDDPGSGILRVNGMTALDSDSVYQVWVRRRGETISQSLFNVSHDGDGAAAVAGDLEDADAVLVTREPAGGVPAPTGDPVLTVTL